MHLKRQLSEIPTSELRAAGLLEDPLQTLLQYLSQAAGRIEFNKRGGNFVLFQEMERLPLERQSEAEHVMRGIFGHIGRNISPGFSAFNNFALAATSFTVLSMTLLSSLADPVYSMVRAGGGLGDVRRYFRQAVQKQTFKENVELSRMLGTTTSDALNQMFMTVGAMDFANAGTKRALNTFFRWTGVEHLNLFARTMAAGMARESILNAAEDPAAAKNKRFLTELYSGLPADAAAADATAWVAAGKPIGDSRFQATEDAMRKFVLESTINPTPSTRPALGNDPRFASVYMLTPFFFDFGARIMAGTGRELRKLARVDNNWGGAAQLLLFSLGVTAALAALASSCER